MISGEIEFLMRRLLLAAPLVAIFALLPACSSNDDPIESSFDAFYVAHVEEQALAAIDGATDDELCAATFGGDCEEVDLDRVRMQVREASTVGAAHRSFAALCSRDDDGLKSYFVTLLQFATDDGLIDVDRLFPDLQNSEEPPRVRFDLVLLAAACPDRLDAVASADRAAFYREYVSSI